MYFFKDELRLMPSQVTRMRITKRNYIGTILLIQLINCLDMRCADCSN